MILQELGELKLNYQKKVEYFKNLSFDNLASDFQDVVNLIDKMENYIRHAETAVKEETVQIEEASAAAQEVNDESAN